METNSNPFHTETSFWDPAHAKSLSTRGFSGSLASIVRKPS